MLRRYGVMREPWTALRTLAVEGAICAGQLLRDRTTEGLRGRVQGFRAAAGLPRREIGAAELGNLTPRESIELRRRRRG